MYLEVFIGPPVFNTFLKFLYDRYGALDDRSSRDVGSPGADVERRRRDLLEAVTANYERIFRRLLAPLRNRDEAPRTVRDRQTVDHEIAASSDDERTIEGEGFDRHRRALGDIDQEGGARRDLHKLRRGKARLELLE